MGLNRLWIKIYRCAHVHGQLSQGYLVCVFSPHLQSCFSLFVLLRSLSQRHLSGLWLTEIPQRVDLLLSINPIIHPHLVVATTDLDAHECGFVLYSTIELVERHLFYIFIHIENTLFGYAVCVIL